MLVLRAMREWARRVLLVLSVALALGFGAATIAIAARPAWVERQVRAELVRRVAGDVVALYPALGKSPWAEAMGKALGQEVERIEDQRARSERLRGELAGVIVTHLERHLCQFDCTEVTESDRQLAREAVSERLTAWLPRDHRALPRVVDWAQGHYQALMAELLRDLGAVAVTNTLTFALAALGIRRSGGSRSSLWLSAILVVAASFASWVYFFEQNWLQTLLFSDWVGYGYAVWVLLLAALLSDAAFNRGRILARVLAELPGVIVAPA